MSLENIHRKMGCISNNLSYLGSIALLAMMLLTTVDVIGRYFFNKPVLGAFELTEFLVLILIFSFLAPSQAKKSHVAVDLIVQHLPERLRAIIDVLNHLLCLMFMSLIAYRGYVRALEIKEFGEATSNLGIIKYPFAFFVVFGCAALSIEYLRDLIRLLIAKPKGENQ
jgi:TRAP-type C4-dicarboxylate transport system permease small subunit